MLYGLAALLVFQLVGEVCVRLLGLPIAGPVCGFALLLGWLIIRKGREPDIMQSADAILRHFALLFVPAGTGILALLPQFRDQAWVLGGVVLLSAVMSIALTGWIVQRLAPDLGAHENPPPDQREPVEGQARQHG